MPESKADAPTRTGLTDANRESRAASTGSWFPATADTTDDTSESKAERMAANGRDPEHRPRVADSPGRDRLLSIRLDDDNDDAIVVVRCRI